MATSSTCHVIYILCLLVSAYSLVLSQTPCNSTELQILTGKCFQDQGIEPVEMGLVEIKTICSKKPEYKAALSCIEKTLKNCYMTGGKTAQDIPSMADYNSAIDYICGHQQDVNMTCVNNTQLNSIGCLQGMESSYSKNQLYQNLTLRQRDCLVKRIARDCQTESPCGRSSVQVLLSVVEILYPECFTQNTDLDNLRCSTPGARDFNVCFAREGLEQPDNVADVLDMCSMKTAYIRALTCTQSESITCDRALMKEEITPTTDFNKPVTYLCQHKQDVDETCLRRENPKFEDCIQNRSASIIQLVNVSSLSETEQACMSVNISIQCTDEFKPCGQQTVDIVSNLFKLSAFPHCSISTEGIENSAHHLAATFTMLFSFLFVASLAQNLSIH